MGYDMTVVETGIDNVDSDIPDFTYLRRNIWGQKPFRDFLMSVDAAYSAYENWPEWPEYPGDDHFDGDYDPIDEAGKAYENAKLATQRWAPEECVGIPIHKLCDNSGWHVTQQECKEALAAIVTHVTGNECIPEESLKKAEENFTLATIKLEAENPDVFHPEYNMDVVKFLITAVRHDGFRVY